MLAADSSTPFTWSFKLVRFIMMNVFDALEVISKGDHRSNNC